MSRIVAGAAVAGALVLGTAGVASLPSGGAETAVSAPAAVSVGGSRPVAQPAWERQVLAGVQVARAARKARPLTTDRCLTRAARDFATRLAARGAADRLTDWGPVENAALTRCGATSRVRLHADAAWQADSRTATVWVRRNVLADRTHLDPAWRKVGVGASRDRHGRVHVVVVQTFTTRR